MFLWSLEVFFPHPINTNSEEENSIIRNKNLIKKTTVAEIPHLNNIVKDDISDDDDADDDENNCNGEHEQIREEMFGIETRQQIRVVINEPLFYETFRECHRDEWNRLSNGDII